MADAPYLFRSQSDFDTLPTMHILGHLNELRRRITYALLSVGVGFACCWHFSGAIYGYLQRPIFKALAAHRLSQQLVYLNPTEPFNLYLKISFLAGIFLACPFILYQVWMFIAPALYRREKRYFAPFLISTVALFVAGGFFGYKLAYPAALDFLIGYGAQFQPMITVTEYTNLFMTIILGLGTVFEMPILIFFLSFMGIVSARWLWRNLRYSILAIFVLAAIFTPTTDIMNMCIFAAPMIALYLAGIGVAWLVHPTRRRQVRA